MSNDQVKIADTAETMGTAEWIAAQTDPRGKLIGELVMEVRAAQSAVDQVDEAANEALGINRSAGRCVDIIDRNGRMTAGQLAEQAGLTTGAVTAILDKLEEKGLVRRLPDPDDRRRVLVETTEKMTEQALELYGPLKETAEQWIDERSDDELRLLIEFNRVSRQINEHRAAEIRARLEEKG